MRDCDMVKTGFLFMTIFYITLLWVENKTYIEFMLHIKR